MSNAIDFVKATFSEWSQDKASRLAAAVAYYTVFSLAPLLIIAIAVAGLIFGEEAARGEIVGQIEGAVGPEVAQMIQTMLSNAGAQGSGIAAIIGVATLILGATGLFVALKGALNTIWGVEEKPGMGVMGILRSRALAFLMVLAIGLLLLLFLAVSAAIPILADFSGNLLPGGEALWQVLSFVVSFAVITLLFAVVYKVLPDVEISWSDVWVGAAVTALLFSIGRFLIGLYLGRSGTASVFGAAGSLVVLLLWIYYSAQILFLGAEFTQVYARRYGNRIVPSESAVPLSETVRTKEVAAPREEARPRTAPEHSAVLGRAAAPGYAGASLSAQSPMTIDEEAVRRRITEVAPPTRPRRQVVAVVPAKSRRQVRSALASSSALVGVISTVSTLVMALFFGAMRVTRRD